MIHKHSDWKSGWAANLVNLVNSNQMEQSSEAMMNSIQVLNDLPCLVLEKIFGYLEVFERIRMMSVCKRWKMLIESGEKHLCFYHSPYPVSRFWFYPNRKEVSDLDKVKVRFRRARLSTSDSYRDTEIGFPKFCFLKNIKKLAFCSVRSDHCHLTLTESFNSLLNTLYQLNELIFSKVSLSSKFTKIELENLKVLTFNTTCVDEVKSSSTLVLNLETPKLESISFHLYPNQRNFSINLLYPEAVKSVSCFRFDETFEKCSNLETVSFEKIRRPSDLLASHPKLKRIEAFPWDDPDVQGIQMLRRSLKQQLRRRSLELIVSGSPDDQEFCFFSPDQFLQRTVHSPFRIDATNLNQFVEHCKRMTHPVPIGLAICDYSNATEAFGGRLPSNFLTLFPKFRQLVVASQKVDAQVLFDLLADCAN